MAVAPHTVNFDYLFALRNHLGPLYGSEDLCVLLYSFVKRERPSVVVELGTGLGVTTAWIAAAMAENRHGRIYTFDNGDHFESSKIRGNVEGLDGLLEPLRSVGDYLPFMEALFQQAGVADHVTFRSKSIDFQDTSWLDQELGSEKVDIVFSDFNHSPITTGEILSTFLPRMTEVSSIFIDSASTHLPTYWFLENVTRMLNDGKVPKEFLKHLREDEHAGLRERVSDSSFKLMHLVERRQRSQNSTAWLRIEPASLMPALATAVH